MVNSNLWCQSLIYLTLSQTSFFFFLASAVQVFSKEREKEKSLVTSNFFFPTVFSTLLENFLPYSLNLKLSPANSFSMEESKICCLGKGKRIDKNSKAQRISLDNSHTSKWVEHGILPFSKGEFRNLSILVNVGTVGAVSEHPTRKLYYGYHNHDSSGLK